MTAAQRRDSALSVQRIWRGEAGAVGAALSATLVPFELAFRAVAGLRTMAYDHALLGVTRVDVPVVSVGNIAVGGAGKTPFSAYIARRLAALGHTPALLHGGYAADEPALHRQWNPDYPVIVGRDRVASARRAAADGASVVILDDGFQHRRLARDVELVLVAAETWTRAPRLLPRGPWREPPAALQRASAIVCTERTVAAAAQRDVLRSALEEIAPGVPVCRATLYPDRWRRGSRLPAPPSTPAAVPQGGPPSPGRASDNAPVGPALALAAIAHPELFLTGARAAGADVEELLAFRDHHDYDEADAQRIRTRAAGRPIVTTAKDWVKLGSLLDPEQVWILEQRVVMVEGGDVLDALLGALPRPA